MITVENHLTEDEIWVLDTNGATDDVQVIIRDDTVFISQLDHEAGMQVIQMTPEQFGNIYVGMQLPTGTYETGDTLQKVNIQ